MQPEFKNVSFMEEQLKDELLLMRITGEDRPGLTAGIMEILAKYEANIMDIGQADIHNTLSLGILIRVTEENSGNVMKHVLFKAQEMGVNIQFSPISKTDYNNWVSRQGKNRYILTVLGRRVEARQIEAVAHLIADQGLNIDSIQRLSGRPSLDPEKRIRACIEFSLRGNPKDRTALQDSLLKISKRTICTVVPVV